MSPLQSLVSQSLSRWSLPDGARVERLYVSENTTYSIIAPEWRSVLRVYRPDAHSREAIVSELAWIEALREARVVHTPGPCHGRDGEAVQTVRSADGRAYHLAMFEYVEGRHPPEDAELPALFEQLGRLAACMHRQSRAWPRPSGFTRPHWNLESIFGADPLWGDWRDLPGLDAPGRALLTRLQNALTGRLLRFGTDPAHYGLIHADMHQANLLTTEHGLCLIDFDDCGFGWYLYDFAASVTLVADPERLPALEEAWLTGYTGVLPLTGQERAILPSLVLLRRILLLGWMGSHPDSQTAAQLLADGFPAVTLDLAEHYLNGAGA